MKKLSYVLVIACCLLQVVGHSQTTVTGDKVVARKQIFLGDYWVDSIQRDTFFLNHIKSLPTSEAVWEFVLGRALKIQAGDNITFGGHGTQSDPFTVNGPAPGAGADGNNYTIGGTYSTTCKCIVLQRFGLANINIPLPFADSLAKRVVLKDSNTVYVTPTYINNFFDTTIINYISNYVNSFFSNTITNYVSNFVNNYFPNQHVDWETVMTAGNTTTRDAYFLNNGVGKNNKIVFGKSIDSALLQAVEYLTGNTLYDVALGNHPDNAGNKIRISFNDWQSPLSGWSPAQFNGIKSTYTAARAEYWQRSFVPTTKGYYTQSESPVADTASVAAQEAGVGTSTLRIDATGFTGDSSRMYWIKTAISQTFATGKMDVMFVLDTTGSMGDVIYQIKQYLNQLGDTIAAKSSNDYRLGLITFGDKPVTTKLRFGTNNITAFKAAVNSTVAWGGGNTPEASHIATDSALNAPWRSDATKLVFVITDAPPGGQNCPDYIGHPSYGADNYFGCDVDSVHAVIAHAKAKGVKISGYFASTDPFGGYGTETQNAGLVPARDLVKMYADSTGGLFGQMGGAGVTDFMSKALDSFKVTTSYGNPIASFNYGYGRGDSLITVASNVTITYAWQTLDNGSKIKFAGTVRSGDGWSWRIMPPPLRSETQDTSLYKLYVRDNTTGEMMLVNVPAGNKTITYTSTNDVTGTASGTTTLTVSQTVVGLMNKALPSLTTGKLAYNGSSWFFDNATYLTGNQTITFTGSNDVTASTTGTTALAATMTVTGIRGKSIPTLSTGKLAYNGSSWFFDNATYLTGNQTITWTGSGDVTGSSSSSNNITPSLTVTGIRGVNVPALSAGFLKYTGSAWTFDNNAYLTSSSFNVGDNSGTTRFGVANGGILQFGFSNGTAIVPDWGQGSTVNYFWNKNATDAVLGNGTVATASSDNTWLGRQSGVVGFYSLPASANFFNTDLTETGWRSHNMNGYGVTVYGGEYWYNWTNSGTSYEAMVGSIGHEAELFAHNLITDDQATEHVYADGGGGYPKILFYTTGSGSYVDFQTPAVKMSSLSSNGPVYSNGNVLTNTNPSDFRLKNSIEDLPFDWGRFMSVRPVQFYWNSDSSRSNLTYGVIAQELEKIYPSLVKTDDKGEKGVHSDQLMYIMWQAIKQQQQQLQYLLQYLQKNGD